MANVATTVRVNQWLMLQPLSNEEKCRSLSNKKTPLHAGLTSRQQKILATAKQLI